MEKNDEKLYEAVISDREYFASLIYRLSNCASSMVNFNNKTIVKMLEALDYAYRILKAKDPREIPRIENEKVAEYYELICFLRDFADAMYPSRHSSILRTFLSHDEYVRALDLAISEFRKNTEIIILNLGDYENETD